MFLASTSSIATSIALSILAAPLPLDDQSIPDQVNAFIATELTPHLIEFDRRAGLIDEAEYLRELSLTPIETTYALNLDTYFQSFGSALVLGQGGFGAMPSIPGVVFGVNRAKNRIIECFQTHDPANAQLAAQVAAAWAASEGC
jgi:hypothetical protein